MPDLIFPRSRAPVQSVHARTGNVVGEAGDYEASEIEFAPPVGMTSDNVQSAIEEVFAGIVTDTDDQTAAEVPFTPAGTIAATNVQAAIEELDADIQGLGPGYTDDDVIAVLTDVLEDGYGINWAVSEDTVGTHFQPDRIVTLATDTYASDIEIDLAASVGELHRFTLTGNPTLTLVNFEHNSPGEPGKQFTLNPVQDATGGRTIDFDGSSQIWTFPDGQPALTSIPGGEDFLVFRVEDVSPATFRFVRAIHRPRRIDLSADPNGVSVSPQAHWDLQEAAGTSRVDEVANVELFETGDPVPTETGMQGNAVNWADNLNWLQSSGTSALRLIPGQSYTLTAWFKADADYSNLDVMLQSSDGGATNNHFGVSAQGAADYKFRATVSNGTTSQSKLSSDLTFSATWHLIAVRFDAVTQTIGISVDGLAFATASYTGTLADTNSWRIVIAGDVGNSTDEVTLWPASLSDSDVGNLWASGAGWPYPFGTLAVLDWRYELNYVTLQAGSGTYTIERGDVQPFATCRVAVERPAGASGTVALEGVDFGNEGSPTLPGSGKFDLYDLTAIDADRIVGRTLQTGCTP